MAVYHTEGAAETIALGRALASLLKPGDVVAFYGDLGAGKTTMIKGIAAGLGVSEVVKSPSFVIATEYQGRLPVYHIDLYRLDEKSDFGAFGFEDYLTGDGVCLVEWAERAEPLFRVDTIRIRIAVTETGRSVTVEGLSGAPQPVE